MENFVAVLDCQCDSCDSHHPLIVSFPSKSNFDKHSSGKFESLMKNFDTQIKSKYSCYCSLSERPEVSFENSHKRPDVYIS